MRSPIELLTGELDRLDNAITERLGQLAEIIHERVNVRITVRVDAERDLAFGKRDGKWCFIVIGQGGEVALVNRARDERVEMVEHGHLERLLADAEKQISEMVPSRRAAVAKLDTLIATARALRT